MKWKLDDSRPIWPQLKDHLVREIICGNYKPGGGFPTVRDLAQEAGVNRNTMQRALSELENEGLVITNRTTGRVVTDDMDLIEMKKKNIAAKVAENFIEEMKALGFNEEEAINLLKERGDSK